MAKLRATMAIAVRARKESEKLWVASVAQRFTVRWSRGTKPSPENTGHGKLPHTPLTSAKPCAAPSLCSLAPIHLLEETWPRCPLSNLGVPCDTGQDPRRARISTPPTHGEGTPLPHSQRSAPPSRTGSDSHHNDLDHGLHGPQVRRSHGPAGP
jgi:hypothetical protein